jgi:hypothetical protein
MCESCGYNHCSCHKHVETKPCYEESYLCKPCDPCSNANLCKTIVPAKCTIYNGPSLAQFGLGIEPTVEDVIIALNNYVISIQNIIANCCNGGQGIQYPIPTTTTTTTIIPQSNSNYGTDYNWFGGGSNCVNCISDGACKKLIPAFCTFYQGSSLSNLSQSVDVNIEVILATFATILAGLNQSISDCCIPPTTSTTTIAPTTSTTLQPTTSTTIVIPPTTSTTLQPTTSTTAPPTTSTTLQPTTSTTIIIPPPTSSTTLQPTTSTTAPPTTSTTTIIPGYQFYEISKITCGTCVEQSVTYRAVAYDAILSPGKYYVVEIGEYAGIYLINIALDPIGSAAINLTGYPSYNTCADACTGPTTTTTQP